MSEEFVGADIVGLHTMAAALRAHGETVHEIQMRSYASVMDLSQIWVGSNADQFRGEWVSKYSPALAAASGVLREAAERLQQNADEQQRTSDSLDGAGSSFSLVGLLREGASKGWTNVREQWAENQEERRQQERLARWASGAGLQQLERYRGLDYESRLAWWNSLSKVQQEALLNTHPGRFTVNGEFPGHITAHAEIRVLDNVAESYTVSQLTNTTGAELDFGIIHIGGEESMILAERGDRSWTVQMSDRFNVGTGRDIDEGQIELAWRAGLFVEGAETWVFDSKTDAQNFIDTYKDVGGAPISDYLEARDYALDHGLVETDAVRGTPEYLLEIAAEYERLEGEPADWGLSKREILLRDFGDQLVSDERGAGFYAEVKAESPFAELGGGLELKYSHDSVNNTHHASGHLQVNSDLNVGALTGGGSAIVEFEIINGPGGDELIFRVAGENNFGVDLAQFATAPSASGAPVDIPFSADVTTTVGATMEMRMDLNNPELRALADDFMRDPTDAASILKEAYDESEVVIQHFESTTAEAEVDLTVFKRSDSEKVRTTLQTLVKPAGGEMMDVEDRPRTPYIVPGNNF